MGRRRGDGISKKRRRGGLHASRVGEMKEREEERGGCFEVGEMSAVRVWRDEGGRDEGNLSRYFSFA